MVCRQALKIECPPPAADYLRRTVANDNTRAWRVPEWVANTFGMFACCAAQMAWSGFMIVQMQN